MRLHDRLRAGLVARRSRSTLIFDLDAVVVTVYGQQQGARVGYNPRRKGRRSYHPLLCFEAHRHEFWHGSLRPGDASANTGVVHFVRRCLAKVPATLAHRRVRLRADAGFFGGKPLGLLEQWGCGYVVVAKEYPTLRRRTRSARFVNLAHGWGVAEFRYRAHGWPRARRFVVIRRPLPEDPVEAQQLRLFRDRRYAYQVLVTNLKLQPWRVWRDFLALPGRLAHPGHRHALQLPRDYPLRREFLAAAQQVSRLRLPRKF